jgi:hypothetical protein
MTVQEFTDGGYLQEVNRYFFHPLGLALVAAGSADGPLTSLSLRAEREELDGIIFAQELIQSAEAKEKSRRVSEDWARRSAARQDSLGYTVQPIPE